MDGLSALAQLVLREKYNEHKLGATLDDPADRKKDGKPLTINPLVVQIVGSLDDFVSPQDQVDLDVEGVGAWLPCGDAGMKTPSGKNYLCWKWRAATITRWSNYQVTRRAKTCSRRRSRALESNRTPVDYFVLKGALRNPVNFLDTPPEIDENVEHVVFVMHGIRDDGDWTDRVAAAIKEEWAKKNAEDEAEKRNAEGNRRRVGIGERRAYDRFLGGQVANGRRAETRKCVGKNKSSTRRGRRPTGISPCFLSSCPGYAGAKSNGLWTIM